MGFFAVKTTLNQRFLNSPIGSADGAVSQKCRFCTFIFLPKVHFIFLLNNSKNQ